MDLELIVHGVPKGQDFFGDAEEQSYIGSFYTGNSNVVKKMLVEVRLHDNKKYTYYNYIVYNTLDYDGRSGGYFALSIRVDAFCIQVLDLLYIFDIIYKRYVIGLLIKVEQDRPRYLMPEFASKQAEIKTIETKLIEFIQLSFSGNDFIHLDSTFNVGKNQVLECNLRDCTVESILSSVRKYSSVAISEEYKSTMENQIEKQYQTRLAEVSAAKDKEMDGVMCSLRQSEEREVLLKQQYEERIWQVQDEKEKLNKKIDHLYSQNKKYESLIRQYEQVTDVSNAVSQIREPIHRLAALISNSICNSRTNYYSSSENGHKGSEKSLLSLFAEISSFLCLFLLLCLLGIVVYLGFIRVTDNHVGHEDVCQVTQIEDVLQVESDTLNVDIDTMIVSTIL